MTDLEKVIEGLECHKRAMYGEVDEHGLACNTCPYKDMESTCHTTTEGQLIGDALALLKAEQPRVMTLEEAVEYAKLSQFERYEKAPVYVEYHYHKWLDPKGPNTWLVDDRKGEYNKANKFGWRCWTSWPTDEQRKEAKWNG